MVGKLVCRCGLKREHLKWPQQHSLLMSSAQVERSRRLIAHPRTVCPVAVRCMKRQFKCPAYIE